MLRGSAPMLQPMPTVIHVFDHHVLVRGASPFPASKWSHPVGAAQSGKVQDCRRTCQDVPPEEQRSLRTGVQWFGQGWTRPVALRERLLRAGRHYLG